MNGTTVLGIVAGFAIGALAMLFLSGRAMQRMARSIRRAEGQLVPVTGGEPVLAVADASIDAPLMINQVESAP